MYVIDYMTGDEMGLSIHHREQFNDYIEAYEYCKALSLKLANMAIYLLSHNEDYDTNQILGYMKGGYYYGLSN